MYNIVLLFINVLFIYLFILFKNELVNKTLPPKQAHKYTPKYFRREPLLSASLDES